MTLIMFIIGLVIGGTAAFLVLCCFQIEKSNEYEREIKKLKDIIKREMSN